MKKFLSLLMLLATGLAAQNAPTPVTGSVSGRVLESDTNRPLVGVAVHSSEGRSYGKSVKTDAQGRYILPDLTPGRRSVNTDNGVSMNSTTQPQIVSVVGGRDTTVDFYIRTFAQISGQVFDEDGTPVTGVQVAANRKEYESYESNAAGQSRTDELQLVSVLARALTDDQGRYVITNIPAGREYWIAASIQGRNVIPISDAPAEPHSRRRTLAATYYPNANSIDSALAIRLHSQEDHNGVNIRMLKAESYCLDATLTDGGVPASLRFLLVDTSVTSTRFPSANLPGSSASGSDGKIRLCDLYPGRYRLIAARLSSTVQESIGAMDITISDNDVRDVVVAAIPRSTVSGEIVWDKRPNDVSNMAIRVRTYPTPMLPDPSQQQTPSETFFLNVVEGSSYIPVISGLDSHSYVKEIHYGGSNILYRPFLPSRGDAKLIITIGTDAGSIAATVLGTSGQTCASCAVLIVPLAARTESEVASTFHAGITDENGMYREGPLPPGKYEVFATRNPPPNRIDRDQVMLIDRTPEAIQRIMDVRARGKIVDVGPSSAISVSLVPIGMD